LVLGEIFSSVKVSTGGEVQLPLKTKGHKRTSPRKDTQREKKEEPCHHLRRGSF
jgi:hypothetical protein